MKLHCGVHASADILAECVRGPKGDPLALPLPTHLPFKPPHFHCWVRHDSDQGFAPSPPLLQCDFVSHTKLH